MEKKDIGNNLILLGTLLYIIAIIILLPLSDYSNYIFMKYRYDSVIGEPEMIILGLIVIAIDYLFATSFIICGGIWSKKKRDYWFILIGVILIFSSIFFQWFSIFGSLFRISLISSSFFYVIINPSLFFLIPVGIIFITIGALIKPSQK
ncbi:MAG: hypothetical protein ACFE9Z_13410 [Promethearchaeota archaeon]